MDLEDLKKYIEQLPEGTRFDYSLSDPFSWRGSYDEVAFRVDKKASSKEDILKKINMALNEKFEGYKGGDYTYKGYTPVNFEPSHSSYTDGGYTEEIISRILGIEESKSPQERLIKLIFPQQ